MAEILKNDWQDIIGGEFDKPYYAALREFLIEAYSTHTVYPDKHDIFNALHFTPYAAVKVVVLGQDPYHGPGQAHGLCFSVKPGVPAPPSLVNIFKELHGDLGITPPKDGYLKQWALQGVLMLNTVLTVQAGQAHSHKGKGWETFTDAVIEAINAKEAPVVFWLWGRPAQTKKVLITNPAHLILEAPHPSPLSAHRGFLGSKPFSKTNAALERWGQVPIYWGLK